MVIPTLQSCDDHGVGGSRVEAGGEKCEAETIPSFTEAMLLKKLLKATLLHTLHWQVRLTEHLQHKVPTKQLSITEFLFFWGGGTGGAIFTHVPKHLSTCSLFLLA